MKGSIERIKTDYVKPQEGTAHFAFGFIPSEAVYQYLTECEMTLVAEAAKQSVVLVSPATLAINLNLLLLAVSLQAFLWFRVVILHWELGLVKLTPIFLSIFHFHLIQVPASN